MEEKESVDGTSETEQESEEEEAQSEEKKAKRDRKVGVNKQRKLGTDFVFAQIADLEISNQSLLAINATLERSKARLEREVDELRRKLWETRLALPRGKYRVVSEDAVEEPAETGSSSEDEAADETELDRLGRLVVHLVSSGRAALERKVEVRGIGVASMDAG
jgi:hypothetical protein